MHLHPEREYHSYPGPPDTYFEDILGLDEYKNQIPLDKVVRIYARLNERFVIQEYWTTQAALDWGTRLNE